MRAAGIGEVHTMGIRQVLGCLSACLLFLVLAGSARGGEKVAGGIVSLAPSITETLFAMGLGEQVAGTTEYSDYPPAAKAVPRIGRFLAPEPERIIALRPRVCVGLVGSTPPQLVRLLGKFGIPTLLVDVSRMDAMLASIERMAAYLGQGGSRDSIAGGLCRTPEAARVPCVRPGAPACPDGRVGVAAVLCGGRRALCPMPCAMPGASRWG